MGACRGRGRCFCVYSPPSRKVFNAASRRVMAQAIAGLVQTALNTFREGGE